MSEKMNDHTGSEVQKSASTRQPAWHMVFSNGRTRNFVCLLFPTRHGEKEEEKVLNENKGESGMSEDGLRS
jgi:hypothetical protein